MNEIKKYGTGMIIPKVDKLGRKAVLLISKQVVKVTIEKLFETKELKEGDRLDVRLWVTPQGVN